MKQLFPVSLAILLAACATVTPAPQPGTDAHQRKLEKEARENFYAMQAENRRNNPHLRARAEARARAEEVARAEERSNRTSFNPFASTQRTPKPAKAISRRSNDDVNPFARYEKRRNYDDTIYLYDMPNGPEPKSERYRAYKIKYAHSLAKSPDDLTPEEREWVRRHYRD